MDGKRTRDGQQGAGGQKTKPATGRQSARGCSPDPNTADANKQTAKFGIDFKSVTTGEGSNKKTTNYAIIVFEAGANK